MTALALRRAGARPVRLRAGRPVPENELRGLVIGGGSDVDPLVYGEEPDPVPEEGDRLRPLDWVVGAVLTALRILLASHTPSGYDAARDRLESRLLRTALQRDLPVLGICRGAQLMNVALGGTLYQTITHLYTEDTRNVRSILPCKQVRLSEGSRLAGAVGARESRVNALHNQAVKDLGEGMAICAVETTGVVQGVECPEREFFIGVQWHPEYMPQRASQQRLFKALVAAARTD
jgi:putative glutamine amidotransferase